MIGPGWFRLGWGVAAGILAGCGPGEGPGKATGRPAYDPGPVPAEHALGAELFLANCSGCHGSAGSGFSGGPPLLDSMYLPPFPDSAIVRAVLGGVARRHWDFDDMPAVRTVRPDQLPGIVSYIRWVQRRWRDSRDSGGGPPVTPAGCGEAEGHRECMP